MIKKCNIQFNLNKNYEIKIKGNDEKSIANDLIGFFEKKKMKFKKNGWRFRKIYKTIKKKNITYWKRYELESWSNSISS